MKYLCLIYADENLFRPGIDGFAAFGDEECKALDDDLKARGVCLASEALEPTDTAAVVRVRDGRVQTIDGPFAEAKEQLAGFYLIEAGDLKAATEIAARIPPARVGSVEVRPVRQLRVPS